MARHTDLSGEPAPATSPAPTTRETLADLAAEAAAQAPEALPEPEAPPPPPEPALELTGACVALVAMVGGIICERYRVTPLSSAETQGLGSAIAGVAALYLPADMMDPITARWLALGGAVLAVTVPRLGQRKEAEPAPASVVPVRAMPAGGEPLPPGPIT